MTTTFDFVPQTLSGHLARLAAGESCESLMGETLARIEAYETVQPAVWISRRPSAELMQAARRIDARLAAGEALALPGVPFAVKDNIDVAGLPTTAACPGFAFMPEVSATVVAQIEAAGGLCVGKTNLDQFATGLVGTRSPYGAPACVLNRDYISGGSSSGSAVAVAAGLAVFALGTDTAGSGRVPAAFNGLVGLKPTRGRWSTTGVTPACRSLDCVSVFAACVADAAHIDAICASPDPLDPYSRQSPPTATPRPGMRVGMPRADQLNFMGDGQAARLYGAAVDRLRAAGASALEVDIAPLLEAARLLYSGPWLAERAAALKEVLRTPQIVHPVVRAIIEPGRGLSAVETFEGAYALKALEQAAARIWADVDFLILPTTPTIYRISEALAEPFGLNANLGLYTNFVNLLDMSAIALPAGYRSNATGVGVSLIAPAFAEPDLLRLASAYEAACADLERPPTDLGPAERRARLAVVGAHLSGMPLHWQLASRNARLVGAARTSDAYRLFAISGSVPPKPALVHVGPGAGAPIDVEIYELDLAAFGSFTEEVPAPLAIGTLELEDGSAVKGFVAEPRAVGQGAPDITIHGGWRAYLASLAEAS